MTYNIPNTIYVIKKQPKSGFSYDEDNLKQEYKFLNRYIDKEEEHNKSFCEHNKDCNRYKDIRPFTYNTIEINKGKEGNHYINASGINAYQKNFFIATQGPKEKTIKDFWTMIDEQGCKMIVMLCQLKENNKSKCENYWNTDYSYVKKVKEGEEEEEKEGEHVNNIIPQWTFRDIHYKLPNSNEDKKVRQMHFTEWKDKDVPDIGNGEIFNNFIDSFDCIDRQSKGKISDDRCSPVVVHCSAGVGRTGTYIAMYYLYKEIMEQKDGNVIKFSIFNLVRKLKEMRAYLVQTDQQYLFLYKFAEHLLKKINFI